MSIQKNIGSLGTWQVKPYDIIGNFPNGRFSHKKESVDDSTFQG
jgi:hypothetical protein